MLPAERPASHREDPPNILSTEQSIEGMFSDHTARSGEQHDFGFRLGHRDLSWHCATVNSADCKSVCARRQERRRATSSILQAPEGAVVLRADQAHEGG